ncbi:MAG: hypothetical protein IKE55_03220 [Kiritimatiellae bacterium]|nr:hypothetical protein [Kiritimatiellia bacterium]
MPYTSDVRVGAPDQLTTGAIKHAPIGTALPSLASITPAAVTLNEAFTGDEYVSEAGLTLTPSASTSEIKEWGGATVRKVLQSFDGTLSWTMISTNEGALGVAFGADHVTASAATTAHGNQLMVELGAFLPEAQSWVFLMKDGQARMVVLVPNGQVTEVGEVTFAANAAVGWQVTLSTYPDASGNSIYILTDDGKVTSA